MLVALAIVLAFCMSVSINWGTTRLCREADSYENQLDEWLGEQKSILYMLTDVISSKPELLKDYDSAVRWLSGITKSYPDISLCYMANPYNKEHPVIMSNGWEPGEDYRPETRPWYRETERATDGFNISSPYLDAQSGSYCITLSRVVYGSKGEFLGIFGIDFFLEKLIHVLIAEDQEINAEILCELLEMEGVSSEWARNGLQALQMFEQSEEGHFDAILMGMRMPEMDGLAATQKIRKLNRPDATTIPIIALTANAFEEDVKSCLSAGMNAHMSKPVDIDLLIRKLTELTSS